MAVVPCNLFPLKNLSAVAGPILTFRCKKNTPAPGGDSFHSSDSLPPQMQKIFRENLVWDTIIAVFMGSSPPPAAPEGVRLQYPAGRFYRAVHTPVLRLSIAASLATAPPMLHRVLPKKGQSPRKCRSGSLVACLRLKRLKLRLSGLPLAHVAPPEGSYCRSGTGLQQKKVPDTNFSH
jgi:hypothetical protein